MSVVSRRVAAVPVRTSTQTWHAIVDLLTRPQSPAVAELTAITNVAAVLISEEYTAQAPIIVSGTGGPRLRIYTVHGESASDALADEMPLAVVPTDSAWWSLSLPCGVDDLEDMRRALSSYTRIDIRDVTEGVSLPVAASGTGTGRLAVDLGELNRP